MGRINSHESNNMSASLYSGLQFTVLACQVDLQQMDYWLTLILMANYDNN